MDQGTDDIQQSIEETRHDIEETRASMTEKLELLEERVRETVESAKSTVEDIMENVKETVDETVGTVKDTVGDARSTVEGIVENVKDTMDDTVTMVKRSFDLHYQMDQHPWVMLSGSVLAGYLLGSLGTRSPAKSQYTTRRSWTGAEARRSGYFATASSPEAGNPPAPYTAETHRSSLWDGTLGQFKEEFDMVKGAIISTLMSNVRDMVKESLPGIAPQLEKAIDSAATKLGAQPLDDGNRERQPGGPYDRAGRDVHTNYPRSSAGLASERRDQPNT
jgi:ElaB/YqjD/DUF883 family membrane-anchored ribosome-binding protein